MLHTFLISKSTFRAPINRKPVRCDIYKPAGTVRYLDRRIARDKY